MKLCTHPDPFTRKRLWVLSSRLPVCPTSRLVHQHVLSTTQLTVWFKRKREMEFRPVNDHDKLRGVLPWKESIVWQWIIAVALCRREFRAGKQDMAIKAGEWAQGSERMEKGGASAGESEKALVQIPDLWVWAGTALARSAEGVSSWGWLICVGHQLNPPTQQKRWGEKKNNRRSEDSN